METDRRRPLAAALLLAAALAAGCLPEKAPLTLAATAARPGSAQQTAHGLTVVVLPYSGEQERRAFGVDLHQRSVVAAEIRLEREAGSTAALKVRRTGIRGRFADGSVRDSLDPAKVYQRNRLNPTAEGLIPRLLIGAETPEAALTGAASEDRRRGVVFGSSAVATAPIDDEHPVAVGFLFFDLAGVRDARLVAIDVEFEDATNSAVRTLQVNVPAAASAPGG